MKVLITVFLGFTVFLPALVSANTLPRLAAETVYYRQGGSAEDWGGLRSMGTETFVPETVTEQFGSIGVTRQGYTRITFPAPYAGIPLVHFQPEAGARVVEIIALTHTYVDIRMISIGGTQAQGIVYWRAIGP
jgi:hypothetical protein